MSIESILGIAGSIITIAAFIGIKCDLVQCFKKRPIGELYEDLLDKKTTDKQRRKILRRLNNYPEINKRIKDEYIERFTLGKLGRETLFHDICNKNDIEPTPALIKDVVGYNMSSNTTKMEDLKQYTKEELHKDSLVSSDEKQTNENTLKKNFKEQTVYMSEKLMTKFPDACNRLIGILEKHSVKYAFLKGTKDIWCRDYMPIHTDDGHLIYYRYNPDYLQTPYYKRSITDIYSIESLNHHFGKYVKYLDLTIDGGNVVICGDKVVMTEKVFAENKDKSPDEVRQLLKEAFLRDIIFLPWDKKEYLGHSDGVIHYIGDNKVLLTNYDDFSPYFYRKYRKILDSAFDVIPLKYKRSVIHRHSWAYINFLKIDNLVLVPQLGIPEDEQAIQQISAAMPKYKVVGIPSLEAVRKGGALNCISWDVYV